MPAIDPCTPVCCSTPQTVNVPGPAGASAITVTTSSFVLPAIAATVVISVADTSWLKAGKNVFISDGAKQANFLVSGAPLGPTSFTGKFLGFVGDSASGTVSAGALVMAGLGDFTVPTDLDTLTAFVDNSGGTPNDTIPVSLARRTVTMACQLSDFATTKTYQIAIPYAFTVNSIGWRTAKDGGGGGASVPLTAKINGVAITNGAGTLALADAVNGSLKDLTSGALAANSGAAGLTLQMVTGTVTNAFTSGDGWFEFSVTNNDLNAFVAAIAAKLNQLRTALRHQ